MRCVLLCMLEAMEGVLGLLEILEVPEVLEGDALCATLYTGGCRGTRGGALCATPYAGDCGESAPFTGGVRDAGGAGVDALCPAGYMLEVMDGVLCLQEILEGLEMLEAPEAMCCVLFCMLDAVEDALCFLAVLEALEVICLGYSVCWRLWSVSSVC